MNRGVNNGEASEFTGFGYDGFKRAVDAAFNFGERALAGSIGRLGVLFGEFGKEACPGDLGNLGVVGGVGRVGDEGFEGEVIGGADASCVAHAAFVAL
jgi:hypothetical protein